MVATLLVPPRALKRGWGIRDHILLFLLFLFLGDWFFFFFFFFFPILEMFQFESLGTGFSVNSADIGICSAGDPMLIVLCGGVVGGGQL